MGPNDVFVCQNETVESSMESCYFCGRFEEIQKLSWGIMICGPEDGDGIEGRFVEIHSMPSFLQIAEILIYTEQTSGNGIIAP